MLKTHSLEKTMFLLKIKQTIKKYWKYIVASIVGLFLLLKIVKRDNVQKQAYKNEIDSNRIILDIVNDAEKQKKQEKKEIIFNHEKRQEIIVREKEDEVQSIRNEFDDRIKENNKKDVDALAKEFANTFGVNHVERKKD